MIKLGELGDCVFGVEMLVGFAVGVEFFWEAEAAMIELGVFRVIIDWDSSKSRFEDY